jgi:hypothetical protein
VYVVERKRVARTDKDLRGNKLHGCEVCWTCNLFNAEFMQCWIHYRWLDFSDGRSYKYIIDDPVFKKPIIKDPDWRRCVYWRQKIDEE